MYDSLILKLCGCVLNALILCPVASIVEFLALALTVWSLVLALALKVQSSVLTMALNLESLLTSVVACLERLVTEMAC